MPYYVLNFDPEVDLFEILVAQVDSNLNQYGSGSPIGVRAASRPGITYINSDNGAEYVATVADGTVLGTTWVQRVYSIANATTESYGVLKIASQADVDEGTATDLAVTPSSLAALARSSDLSAEIAARISADALLDLDITALESVVGTATAAATANAVMRRDASARAQVASPSVGADIANKTYVDGGDSAIQAQVTPLTAAVGAATANSTVNTIVLRDNNGRAQVVSPSANGDIANKSYVDSAAAAATAIGTAAQSDVDALETVVGTPVSAATNNAIIKRDASARAQVAAPSAGGDIVNKTYADALGVSTATNSTIMRRDASGRAAVANPSASGDIANKAYADALGVSTPTVSTIVRRDAAGRFQAVAASANDDVVIKSQMDSAVLGLSGDKTVAQCRVAVTSGDVWGLTDVTSGGGTLYIMPIFGGIIGISNSAGTSISLKTISAFTVSLAGKADGIYRIYVYDSNADNIVDSAELVAWSNTTTPPSDSNTPGFLVKSTDFTRRAIADVYVNNNETRWSSYTRYITHIDPRSRFPAKLVGSHSYPSWTCGSVSSWRPFNNNAGSVGVFFIGNSSYPVKVNATVQAHAYASSGSGTSNYLVNMSMYQITLGTPICDLTSALISAANNTEDDGIILRSEYKGYCALPGFTVLVPIETNNTTRVVTVMGINAPLLRSGILAEVWI